MIHRIACSSSKRPIAARVRGSARRSVLMGRGVPHHPGRLRRIQQRTAAASLRIGTGCPTIRRRSITMTLRNGRADMARNASVAKKPESLPVTKLEPTEAEQAEIRGLAKRKKARRRAPRFTVHQQENNPTQVMPSGVHAD